MRQYVKVEKKIGNRFLRFGLKRHSQVPHTDSNGPSKFVYTDSCYSLIFSMDLERMDCQIKRVMSSREEKLDFTWVRYVWLAGESEGCKNNCEDTGEGTKG